MARTKSSPSAPETETDPEYIYSDEDFDTALEELSSARGDLSYALSDMRDALERILEHCETLRAYRDERKRSQAD